MLTLEERFSKQQSNSACSRYRHALAKRKANISQNHHRALKNINNEPTRPSNDWNFVKKESILERNPLPGTNSTKTSTLIQIRRELTIPYHGRARCYSETEVNVRKRETSFKMKTSVCPNHLWRRLVRLQHGRKCHDLLSRSVDLKTEQRILNNPTNQPPHFRWAFTLY